MKIHPFCVPVILPRVESVLEVISDDVKREVGSPSRAQTDKQLLTLTFIWTYNIRIRACSSKLS